MAVSLTAVITAVKLMVAHYYFVFTPLCKIIPACLNFHGLALASLSNQPQPAKSAIFGKIGGKTINLAGTFLHNGVDNSFSADLRVTNIHQRIIRLY